MARKSAQAHLAYWRSSFSSLSTWDIKIAPDNVRPNGSSINADSRMATIFEWRADEPEPHDYILHELLHIAFAEASRAPRGTQQGCPRAQCKCEDEERVVQDLCELLIRR